MIKLLRVCLLLIIFLLPLATATANFRYEQIKVLLFFFLVSLTSGILLIYLVKNKISYQLDRLDYLGLTFILVLAITSFLGIDPESSFLGKPPYFQGLILYFYLFVFFLVVKLSRFSLKEISLMLSLSALVVSIVAIVQSFEFYLLHLAIPNYAGRVVSTFGQPNLYAGFLVMCLPLIFLNRFWKILSPVVALAIVLSFSRTAIFILVGFLIFKLIKKLSWLTQKLGLMIFLLILGATLFSVRYSIGLFQDEIIAPQTSAWLIYNSPEKRILIWPIIGEFISKRPIFGYGLENLDSLFVGFEKKHEQRSPAYYGIKNISIDRSHNYFLDLLIFSGIVGLIVWMSLVIMAMQRARGALLSSLLIYLTWSLFQTQSVVHLIMFWLLVGSIKIKA